MESSERKKGVGEIAAEFICRGGKRLRPRLCEEVYRHLAPDGAADLSSLTDALESFHKASLIHDDIQDGDTERCGRPTLWCEFGVPVAIAVGDWLLAHGIRRVAEADFPNAAEMSRATALAIQRLCEGQGDELTGRSDYLSICTRKTGALFALAAELGALAAGADPAPYREWGEAYGTLFQVLDDLADEGESPARTELRDRCATRLAGLPVGPFLIAASLS